MIIKMTNQEFQEFRNIIIEVKNPKVTKAFNEAFSQKPTRGIKGFVNPVENDIELHIPEHLSIEVEKVIVRYSASLSKMSKSGVSITSAPKWLSILKNLWNDIIKAIYY